MTHSTVSLAKMSQAAESAAKGRASQTQQQVSEDLAKNITSNKGWQDTIAKTWGHNSGTTNQIVNAIQRLTGNQTSHTGSTTTNDADSVSGAVEVHNQAQAGAMVAGSGVTAGSKGKGNRADDQSNTTQTQRSGGTNKSNSHNFNDSNAKALSVLDAHSEGLQNAFGMTENEGYNFKQGINEALTDSLEYKQVSQDAQSLQGSTNEVSYSTLARSYLQNDPDSDAQIKLMKYSSMWNNDAEWQGQLDQSRRTLAAERQIETGSSYSDLSQDDREAVQLHAMVTSGKTQEFLDVMADTPLGGGSYTQAMPVGGVKQDLEGRDDLVSKQTINQGKSDLEKQQGDPSKSVSRADRQAERFNLNQQWNDRNLPDVLKFAQDHKEYGEAIERHYGGMEKYIETVSLYGLAVANNVDGLRDMGKSMAQSVANLAGQGGSDKK